MSRNDVYKAIEVFISAAPVSEEKAEKLLSEFSPKVQEQLICALYVGRNHIHNSKLQEPGENYAGYTDHIQREEFAKIIYEKNTCTAQYLEKILECAENSGFDLKKL